MPNLIQLYKKNNFKGSIFKIKIPRITPYKKSSSVQTITILIYRKCITSAYKVHYIKGKKMTTKIF